MSEFRRKLMLQKKDSIPYQRIEYLMSNGAQYINTGISMSDDFICEIVVAKEKQIMRYATILGSEGSGVFSAVLAVNNDRFYTQIGISGESALTEIYDDNYHKFNVYYNGKANTIETDDSYLYTHKSTGYSGYVLYLFARNSLVSNINNFFVGRVKSCKISLNNKIVRNFIPVRVGNVGYMYDSVSGLLFANHGSGQFILGADI